MSSTEIKDPSDWLEALDNGGLSPNLMDTQIDDIYKRAWFKEYDGEYYIYYEEGRYDNAPLRMFVGSVAVREIEGMRQDEKKDLMLDSAMASIEDRIDVKFKLRALMGLNLVHFPSPAVRQKEREPNDRFLAQFSNLSQLDREDIRPLGLEHLRAQPFRDPEYKRVYLVSREPMDTKWPALRYTREVDSWEVRWLETHELLSANFEDSESRARAIRERGWSVISEDEIIQLTNRLADNKQINSL